jgi:hypothetical protein
VTAKWTAAIDVDPTTVGRQNNNSFHMVVLKGGKITLVDNKLRCSIPKGC